MTRLTLHLATLVLAVLAGPAIGWAADEAGAHAAPGVGEDLSLWSFVAFLVFFVTCFKLLGGWASSSLAERERTENALMNDAEQKNQLAQQALADRRGRMEAISEEIEERLAEAHRDADYTKQDITAAGQREADVLRNRARTEINRTRNQALNDLFSTMAARVVSQTEQNLKSRLNENEHNRLIDEALGHFAQN